MKLLRVPVQWGDRVHRAPQGKQGGPRVARRRRLCSGGPLAGPTLQGLFLGFTPHVRRPLHPGLIVV